MKTNQAAHSPNYETAVCRNCGRSFRRKRAGDKTNRRLPNGVRGRNIINCSPRCTKQWRDKKAGGVECKRCEKDCNLNIICKYYFQDVIKKERVLKELKKEDWKSEGKK